MASNNQRAPSAPPPSRWSNESKKISKEHQQLILGQVTEMFESTLEPDIILSVVQNCKWKLQPSIDALIMLSENAEVPTNRTNRTSGAKTAPLYSSNVKISKNQNIEGRVREDAYQDRREYKSNLGHEPEARSGANSFLNLNDKELLRQQEEFKKFELLKKDLTEKGFVPSENENVSKPSYSEENHKIPHPKLQQFGQNWSGKNDPSRVYFCSDVENRTSTTGMHVNSMTNQLWDNAGVSGQKKTKETNNKFDNLFGSKLQFSRDLPNDKIGNKGTIPKNSKNQTNVDPAIISACNVAPKSFKASNTKASSFDQADYDSAEFSQDFEETLAQESAQQQQVAQFNSNYDNDSQTRGGSCKSNVHKGETESLCGLKVQYRLPGLENSSDDDADVVIEEESEDYPSQIPSLMSINVGQFISNSTQSPPKTTRLEISSNNTPSPPKSPQRNTSDDKLKNIISSILDGYKVLIILRGLPGSGKSHLGNSIVRSTVGGDPNQFIFSSDDHFMMLGRGVYQYVPSKVPDAHSWNQKRVSNVLKEGVSPVIVDNTNTQSWEMQPYVVMGVQNGYTIEVLEPNTPWSKNVNELARKNSHGVPKDRIKKMLDRYEPNITGPKLIEQFSLRYSSQNVPPQLRKFPIIGAANEGQDKSEKQKPPNNRNRNRRRKRNSSVNSDNFFTQNNTDPANYLLSDSDKNMKHVENSPRSLNLDNTLENIVSNALMSENDTLNKSLVDYCIETDSGDELDSDRVPDVQENHLDGNPRFDLLGDGDKSEGNQVSSSAVEETAERRLESKAQEPPPCLKKISNTLHHQNLGAIGSERKGSVTATDYDNIERKIEKEESIYEENKGENVLSQCWDFTLLLNGKQIHSRTSRSPKFNSEFEASLKNEIKEDPENFSGVIITEIIDDEEDKPTPEDPDTIITKIIDKMDAAESETSKTDAGSASEEPKSNSEAEEGVSSIGSIFNMIKKSLLGFNSEEKHGEAKSEESIMKYKHQTNDNSLSENDAFENEKSHREPTAAELLCDKETSSTIVDDSLSEKLSRRNLSPVNANFEQDLRRLAKLVAFHTTQNNTDQEYLVDDNLSGKLSDNKKEEFDTLGAENRSEPKTKKNQTRNQCVCSSIDSDDALIKNLDEIILEGEISASKNEKSGEIAAEYLAEIDRKDSGIDDAVEKPKPNEEIEDDMIRDRKNDPVYHILNETMHRLALMRETERKSDDDGNSSSDDEGSESSQTESSYLISRPTILDQEASNVAFDLLNKGKESISASVDRDSKNDDESSSETLKDEEIISGIEESSKIGIEDDAAIGSGDSAQKTDLCNPSEKSIDSEKKSADLFEVNEALISFENAGDEDSAFEECCESEITSDSKKSEDKNLGDNLIGEINNDIKGPEIIDNINQVTWKESPFPVPIESIISLLETSRKHESVSKSDAATNTSNYDFNVLYVGGTSEPEYKILTTKSRTINKSPLLTLPEKPPLKLMLDKSSMTSVVDILSGEESLEFKTESETMKDLDDLIEMFPNVPRENVTEIYQNVCLSNFNWAVDMLLDGFPEHVTKYGKIEVPKICGDTESQSSSPRRDKLDKLKLQSSSSESNDSDSAKLQQNNQSPRKKKDKHKLSEESLELKRQMEEKMIMNEASYNPHILRVKRWKNGEPDIASDIKEDSKPSPPAAGAEAEDVAIETQSPKSSESNDDFTEDDIEPEEMMELNLGEDFIKVLENEFGNPEFQFPGGLFPVIQIKKSMAQQLHALWIESMELQLNAQQEQLDKMINKDAEYARSLEEEEARNLSESAVLNLPEIMDMEMALAIYNNDLKKQLELETPNDMASRLTRQMLHEMFTDNDPETLDEILKAHNGNFKETVDVLEASTGQVVNRNNTLERQKSLIDRAKKESIQSTAEELDSRESRSAAIFNRDITESSDSESVALTYDDAMEEAQSSRKEAQRQLSLRNENFNKATEAFRKGNREVAGYYSQMAKLHSKKMEWANSTAASAFLAAQDYMMNAENTLDLHYLYVAEALQALDVFLDYHISRLNEGNKKSMNLYIITGRGARSSRGLSRIKPAVSKKLASKNIRYMDENPGCLKIVIHRRNSSVG